ncbi:MAG TPA: hypothetical protein VHJ20_12960 [Polyangia bacterium]|nr:hypothetical protein [Polyangia bacterium]
MFRSRVAILLVPLALALGAASCTDSEAPSNIPTGGTTGNNGGTTGQQTGGTTGQATGGTTGQSTGGTTGQSTGGTTGQATGGTTGSTGGTTGSTGGTTGSTGGTTGSAGGTTGNGGTTGSGGASGGSTGTVISFATDIYPIIANRCKTCHTTASMGGLSMKDATTGYTNLVGTTMGVAAGTDKTCTLLDASKKRVVVGDAAHSYLYIKIATPAATLQTDKCGPAMPDNGQNGPMTTDEITKIQNWINGGAKP